MHRDSAPKRAVEAVPDIKKTQAHRRSPGLCGEHHWILTNDGPHEEPDIEHSPANDQEDSDKEESEYVAP